MNSMQTKGGYINNDNSYMYSMSVFVFERYGIW